MPLPDADRPAALLDPDRLIRAAEVEAGSCAWGATEFRSALDMLCRSAVDEAALGDAVLAGFAANIHRLLVKRLRLGQDREAHPEIARQEIVAPLVVTGLPRSGTTILHALLAQDPRARSPLKWEVDEPSPPPRAGHFHDDPRIARAAAAIAKLDPEFLAMHTVAADLPEECNTIMTMAFRSPNFNASARLPSYIRWLIHEADMAPAYAFHREFLQHLQAFAPRPFWVLKAPPHLYWLDALLDAYPDARIVVTHRDPAEVLPSNASLIAYLRGKAGTPDPKEVGQEQIDQWGAALDRAMAMRAGGRAPARFVDTRYTDFIRAPMDVVRRVYGHFDMPLTDAAEAAMTAFLADNRKGKHGKHVYAADEFGMSADALHRRFHHYTQAHDVPLAG